MTVLLAAIASLVATQARTTTATAPQSSPPRSAPAAATVQSTSSSKNAEGPGHEEAAQETSEPPTLESRIPPVSGQEYGVADRFEIGIGLGLSFDDPFLEKFVPRLSLGYHIGEQFYVGLEGGYAISTSAGNVGACNTAGGVCVAPTSSQLQDLPGAMTVVAFVEGGWTPFYGKVNLFGEKVFHFDFSLLLGVGGILAQTAPAPSTIGTPQGVIGNGFAFALGPGIAEHFFLSEHVAIAAEIRDYIYFAQEGGSGVQNQPMFNLGLSFLLGSGPPQG
jgi:outer membrane beta-barrel protein